jgi:serine/threonine protein kinase
MLRAPDLVGHALDGRYELHAVLGEGAFGRVYRGLDRRLGRAVAVKVIKPWWAEDSEWVERFQREARLLARVSDAGVVQIFDIGHADEGPYYVAELVEGESLAERLQRGPLAAPEARGVGEQLCRALASAHAQGVVHCDVKPANVLLTPAGTVKVGDFGVARLAEGTSQAPTATVAGTPRYMSPEQARGRPTTSATDVYSAGVVLYEMLAGEPPFVNGSAVELGLRHLQDEPPALPARVPRALCEVVERALAKDPADRFSDGAAMADALGQAELRGRVNGSAPVSVSEEGEDSDPGGGQAGARSTVVLAQPGTIDTTMATTVNVAADRTLVMKEPPGSPSPPRPPSRHAGQPAHRRRRIALLAALLVLAGCTLAVVLISAGGARTTVPMLRGLPRGGVVARARRLHLQPAFSTRYSQDAATGIAIAQDPSPGTRIGDGSTVNVMLSSGPPPVNVPGVVGRSSGSAESLIANAGLRYSVALVAAPASSPGTVTKQSPGPSSTIPSGSTVALSVAEAPRWRALTTFSGVDHGRSVPFRILGGEWRVTYSMAYEGTCLLLVVCFGPSAEARDVQSGSTFGGFELSEGEGRTHTFSGGPGLYSLTVSAGRDSARWSMIVEDHY